MLADIFVGNSYYLQVLEPDEKDGSKGKVTILTGVAKKKNDPTKDKGELMENNMDAMEVTSFWF